MARWKNEPCLDCGHLLETHEGLDLTCTHAGVTCGCAGYWRRPDDAVLRVVAKRAAWRRLVHADREASAAQRELAALNAGKQDALVRFMARVVFARAAGGLTEFLADLGVTVIDGGEWVVGEER